MTSLKPIAIWMTSSERSLSSIPSSDSSSSSSISSPSSFIFSPIRVPKNAKLVEFFDLRKSNYNDINSMMSASYGKIFRTLSLNFLMNHVVKLFSNFPNDWFRKSFTFESVIALKFWNHLPK